MRAWRRDAKVPMSLRRPMLGCGAVRHAVLLLASLLLAGCTWGPASPESEGNSPENGTTPTGGRPGSGQRPTPVTGEAGAVPESCVLLSLEPSIPVMMVGQTVNLTVGVENCGREELTLRPPNRCTVGQSLMVRIESANASYWHYLGAADGIPIDNGLWAASHGPCSTEPSISLVLPKGARHEAVIPWNGTVAKMVREEAPPQPGVTGFTLRAVPGPIAPGWHNMTVELRGSNESEEPWTARAKLYVTPTRDNPDPTAPVLPGLSLWLPSAPPANPPPKPPTPEEYADRVGQRGPDAPPADVVAAAQEVIRWWAGPYASNFTLRETEHPGMDDFCSSGTLRCDRYGWGDWYVLRYQGSFGPRPADNVTVEIPARAGGVVADDEVTGLPHCAATPEECVIRVSEQDAIRIARQEGLANGTRRWESAFFWHRQYAWISLEEGNGIPPLTYGSYAWMVRNTLNEAGSHGIMYVIDANDGRVLLQDQWSRSFI